MYVAIVDTETTGFARDDEAISAGILLLEIETPPGRLIRRVDQYLGYREPLKAIHPAATRVHGLTRELLAGKAFDICEMERLILQADVLVAHNAKFDAYMLRPHVPLIAEKEWRCSWQQVRWPDCLPDEKLDSICAHFGFWRPAPHNAILDCGSLGDCLLAHSGKTTSSHTYLGKLLNEYDYRRSLKFDAARPIQNTQRYELTTPLQNALRPLFASQPHENWSAAGEEYKRERLDGRFLAIGALCGSGLLAVLFLKLAVR